MPGTSVGARKGHATKASRKEENSVALALANADARPPRRSGGYVHGMEVNLQSIQEEYVAALHTPEQRAALYQQMANDAKIAAQLRANILPLISAVRWRVEDGDSEARDLVAANLLRQGDRRYWCETSWQQRLLEHLQCLQFGYALHGKTREVVDGFTIFRRLTYLHPRSLGGTLGPWEFDKSGTRLVAVHRHYRKPGMSSEQVTDERIPIEDIFATVWWMTGENWEGISFLRSMYRAWKEKDLTAKIQMIDLLNRGVGIPKVKLGPNDGKTERDTAKEIVKDMRQGDKSRAFIVEGHEQDYKFLTSEGGTVDSGTILAGKNMEIAAAGATDFMQQGQTDSGSRATGSVLMVSYMQQLDAVREWVQEQVNHGAGYMQGLVEELVYTNFGEDVECPQIIGSRVSPTEQLDNVPNILDAVQKGGLTHDLAVENHVRKALGVKEMTAAEFEKAKKAMEPLGGRPQEVGDFDREEPRDDNAGRAFGLRAEKKSPDASRPPKRSVSYPWQRSS